MPVHCRQHAYELFAAQAAKLATSAGFLNAAIAIAMHEMEEVDPMLVDEQLQDYAYEIRRRVHSDNPTAIVAHAHEVLFDEAGFTGEQEDYYDPANSYVPAVLERKRGLPITLTLIYKDILERLDVRVHGVNAPGHFMAAVETGLAGRPGHLMLVDPFHGGREMNPDEAFAIIEQMTGVAVPPHERMLPVATHRMWLHRMLNNLVASFTRAGRDDDAAAMEELRGLLVE